MPTFGNEPFGSGRFGRGSWGDRVLWGNVPPRHQADDAAAGGYLQAMLRAWADELEEMRDLIAAIPDQRDPYLVRGTVDTEEWYYAAAAVWLDDPDFGAVVALREPALAADWPYTPSVNPPAWTPYAAASRVGPHWAVQWRGSTYSVVGVRLRRFDATYPQWSEANEVLLAGVPTGLWPSVVYDQLVGEGDGTATPGVAFPDAPWRMRRNATATPLPWLVADAAVVVRYPSAIEGMDVALYDVPSDPYDGTGRLYPAALLAPDEIDVTTYPAGLGTVDYERALVTLDLDPAGDVAVAGEPITADCQVAGYYLALRPPSLLPYLARDFGFENDVNEPENVQRSTVANVTKYFGLKATWDSYRIRGEISGFAVDAQAMHRLVDTGFVSMLPADRVYNYGGRWYTTVEPRACRFDDVSADVWWHNPILGVDEPLLDDCFIYADESEDDRSTGLAFALDVTQGWNRPGRVPATVVAVREITAAEAAAYGVVGGLVVAVEAQAEALADFTVTGSGRFGLTQYDLAGGVVPAEGDTVWWIDRDLGQTPTGDPLVMHWEVLVVQEAGAPQPVVGADTAVRYWPEALADTCGYCRSNRIRVAIEPLPAPWGAEAYYLTATEADAAARRLIRKVADTLLPIHVRVLEYALTFYTYLTVPVPVVTGDLAEVLVTTVLATDTFDAPGWPADVRALDAVAVREVSGALVVTAEFVLTGVEAGATVSLVWDPTDFADAREILLTVAQRGDLNEPGETQDVWIEDGAGTVWEVLGVQSGFDDLTWRDVAGAVAVDLTSLLAWVTPVTLKASATAAVNNGEVRFTFTVTR